jgi:3D (Asp-Asp-Asp) domain-containing protein
MPPARVEARVIGEDRARDDGFVSPTSPAAATGLAAGLSAPASGGRALGTFRNTYYDFPSEADFAAPENSTHAGGETVALKSPRCKTIKNVARAFYEAVCVQGSGTLTSGSTVSFAKRDCECAALCPRTEQRICFDELDAQTYPWGRGATGRAIIPLLSVAVDSELIPLDTPLYIPEYDGIARGPSGSAVHDGCFIAQDRGVRVKGQHVDIFTGQREITALWNRLVPSNRGVTVVLDSPHCARAVTRPQGLP